MARPLRKKNGDWTVAALRAAEIRKAGLLFDLQRLIEAKFKRLGLEYCPLGSRATHATQVISGSQGTFLWVYEAGYRGCLWPRLLWHWKPGLAPGSGHEELVRAALSLERSDRSRVFCLIDTRSSVSVPWFSLEEHSREPRPQRRLEDTSEAV